MRYLNEIPDSRFKIGLYAWNNKYIIKIEAGLFEQTYKISELDITGPDDDLPVRVRAMLDVPFLDQVAQRFADMATDWHSALERTEY